MADAQTPNAPLTAEDIIREQAKVIIPNLFNELAAPVKSDLGTLQSQVQDALTNHAGLDTRLTAVENKVPQVLSDLEDSLDKTVKTNPRLNVFLIGGAFGVIAVGALAVLIAYLAGSPQAGKIVGWAVAFFTASSTGIGIAHQLGFLGSTDTVANRISATATSLIPASQFVQGISAPAALAPIAAVPAAQSPEPVAESN